MIAAVSFALATKLVAASGPTTSSPVIPAENQPAVSEKGSGKSGPSKDESKSAGANTTNQPPAVKLQSTPAQYGGFDFGTYETLTVGPGKYEFQVPKGYGTRFLGQQVTIGPSTDPSSGININFIRLAESEAPTPESLEAEALARFSNGTILARFNTSVLGTNAHSFQLSIRTGTDPWQGRVLYIPVEGGQLSISAVASPKTSRETFNVMQQIVNSLTKAEGDGKAKRAKPSVFQ